MPITLPPTQADRIEVIDGEKVLVFEADPPIPSNLGLLLMQMRVTFRDDFRIGGMSSLCQMRDHRFRKFREGRHLGQDGVVRDLRLEMCQDCEAFVVRDVSLEALPDARRGSRLATRRRNEILGWYTGGRKNNREYR